MWELPLPRQLTQCKCGEGELKGLIENDDIEESEAFKNNENPGVVILQESGGGAGDDRDEIKVLKDNIHDHSVENNHDDGRWEVVNRSKVKNNSPMLKNTSKKQRKSTNKKPTLNDSKLPKAGPDPDPSKKTRMSTKSGNPEGRRDSSGLIHCCSCKSVHSSLPDFIKHCKSSQHNNQVVGDFNNNEEDLLEVKREVNSLKKGLIEVMKKGLEKDITSTLEMEQFKEGFERELKKGSATMALLIEKLQAMEDNIVKIDEKLSSLNSAVKTNEEEIDSCFNYGHELAERFANTDKEIMRERQAKDEKNNENKSSFLLIINILAVFLLLTGVSLIIGFGFI